MTDTTQIAANDIITVVTQKPEIALLEPERFNAFLVALRGDINDLSNADMNKAKDRDRVRSVAAGIARHKAAINKARLALTAGWREQTKEVNARGGDIDEKLSDLGDKVREPLTAWEDAEKVRVETCRSVIDVMSDAARNIANVPSAALRIRYAKIEYHELDEATFRDMLDEAVSTRTDALNSLAIAIDDAEKREAEAAELAALRAEKAERDAAHAKREQIERERIATEQATQRAAEQAEARRIAQEAREKTLREEAAAKATRDANEAAERAAAKALADANRIVAEREAAHAREIEKERQIRIDAERARESDRLAAEKREANKRHRAKVIKDAATAITAIDRGGANIAISYEAATAIVEAIIAGTIPRIEMRF